MKRFNIYTIAVLSLVFCTTISCEMKTENGLQQAIYKYMIPMICTLCVRSPLCIPDVILLEYIKGIYYILHLYLVTYIALKRHNLGFRNPGYNHDVK